MSKKTSVWIFVILISLGEISWGHQYISTAPENHSSFLKTQDHFVISDRFDIVLQIPLQPVHEAIDKLCTFSQHLVNGSSSVPNIKNRFKLLCLQDRTTWKAILDALSGQRLPSTRNGRFMIATLISSLASGVLGAVMGRSHDKGRIDKLIVGHNNLLTSVQEAEHRIAINEDLINTLESGLKTETHMRKLRAQLDEASIATLGAFLIMEKDLVRLHRGLTTLVTEQRLDPALVEGYAMHAHLDKVAEKAKEQGLRVAFKSELDLWKSQVSFGTFTDLTLRIIIHVPLYREEDRFDIFRYLAVPVGLNSSTSHGQVRTRGSGTIAVSKDRKRHFDPTTAGISFRGRESFSSSDQTLIRGVDSPSCLWALFRSKHQEILDNCDIQEAPKTSRWWNLDSHKYAVWHPRPRELRIKCKGVQVASEHFSGQRVVSLLPGCFAEDSHFHVRASHSETEGQYTVLTALPLLSLSSLSEQETIRAAASSPSRRPRTQQLHLHRASSLKPLPLSNSESWEWIWAPLLSAASAAALLTALLCTIRQCRRWWRTEKETFRQPHLRSLSPPQTWTPTSSSSRRTSATPADITAETTARRATSTPMPIPTTNSRSPTPPPAPPSPRSPLTASTRRLLGLLSHQEGREILARIAAPAPTGISSPDRTHSSPPARTWSMSSADSHQAQSGTRTGISGIFPLDLSFPSPKAQSADQCGPATSGLKDPRSRPSSPSAVKAQEQTPSSATSSTARTRSSSGLETADDTLASTPRALRHY